jgi:hypothetical protein
MRRVAFERADELRDQHGRLDRNGNMHVRFGPADFVDLGHRRVRPPFHEGSQKSLLQPQT